VNESYRCGALARETISNAIVSSASPAKLRCRRRKLCDK
jgi:hypothetical protein